MSLNISRLLNRPSLNWLMLALLLIVLVTDRYTAPNFAHGFLYTPILILAALSNNFHRLTMTLILSVLFVWAGLWVMPESLNAILASQFIANSVLATLMLLTIFLLSRYIIRLHQQQAIDQLQIQFTANIAQLGYWQLNNEGSLSLSLEAAKLLNQTSQLTLTQQQFIALFNASQQDALTKLLNGEASIDDEFTINDQNTTRQLRIVSQQHPLFPQQIQGIIQDITDRQLMSASLAEELRRNSELQLLRSAVSQLNDMVIITEAPRHADEKPNIVFVNQAFERITGYNRQEVIGKTLTFLQGPKTEQHELNKIKSAYQNWKPCRAQLTQYHKSGREIVLELNIMPIGLVDGTYTHWVSVEREITEEKHLKKQLQLAQRMEAIGQLTGGIAHDFNNLLTVITGNSELLIEELADKPSLQPLAKLISSAAERGAGLTSNLLAFARRQPLSPEAVNINMLIRNMEPLLRSSLGKHFQLDLNLSSDIWPVMIDPVQLESSLLNLTLNARDAMADGGKLMISTERFVLPALTKTAQNELAPGEYVKIDVMDTGDGIPQDLLDKVFEPFFTTKPSGKGSGLGLSMVFGFIKQSGGHIQVQSEISQGTRFQLFIPHTDTVSPAPILYGIETSEATHHTQQTILVVEDNDLVRQYAVSQLRDAGYQVLAASDGSQALSWLASTPQIDLLFTDVLMPNGLSGYELAQQATRLRQNLPVLYTSGYTEKALVEDPENMGRVAILNKPYHRAVLLNKVAQMLAYKT